jgi:hypothetical protein
MSNKLKKPEDKQVRKFTKAENLVLTQNFQKHWVRGLTDGSRMQCNAILNIYKKKLDETPTTQQTKQYYKEMLDNIFKFCLNGTNNDLGTIVASHMKNAPLLEIKTSDNIQIKEGDIEDEQ